VCASVEPHSEELPVTIRLRFLITAAACCCVLFASAAPAIAAPRLWFGVLDDQALRWAPDRAYAFTQAKAEHASVVRTMVEWDQIAQTQPANPSSPFDPAYNFRDLDDFMVHAQQRGIEVLLTIWGTPAWANNGATPNVPPERAEQYAAFVRAVADRYSGRHAGLPFARFISLWNEPNSTRFLCAPDPVGAYAALVEAAYPAAKSASPNATVAIGETSSHHAPGRFVAQLALIAPNLRFDAWAHHPYPPTAHSSPAARFAWPGVGLNELGRFGRAVDRAFGRTDVPLWVTEYAESVSSVSSARQAADLASAAEIAGAVPQVQMFIWLMLRDHRGEPWQSGIVGRPAFKTFRALARQFDPRDPLVEFSGEERVFSFQLPALEIRWHLSAGSRVGVRYFVSQCGRIVHRGAEARRISVDGWVPFSMRFRPRAGERYEVTVQIEDIHGFDVTRTLSFMPLGSPPSACAPVF
jgi:hypothetical protein